MYVFFSISLLMVIVRNIGQVDQSNFGKFQCIPAKPGNFTCTPKIDTIHSNLLISFTNYKFESDTSEQIFSFSYDSYFVNKELKITFRMLNIEIFIIEVRYFGYKIEWGQISGREVQFSLRREKEKKKVDIPENVGRSICVLSGFQSTKFDQNIRILHNCKNTQIINSLEEIDMEITVYYNLLLLNLTHPALEHLQLIHQSYSIGSNTYTYQTNEYSLLLNTQLSQNTSSFSVTRKDNFFKVFKSSDSVLQINIYIFIYKQLCKNQTNYYIAILEGKGQKICKPCGRKCLSCNIYICIQCQTSFIVEYSTQLRQCKCPLGSIQSANTCLCLPQRGFNTTQCKCPQNYRISQQQQECKNFYTQGQPCCIKNQNGFLQLGTIFWFEENQLNIYLKLINSGFELRNTLKNVQNMAYQFICQIGTQEKRYPKLKEVRSQNIYLLGVQLDKSYQGQFRLVLRSSNTFVKEGITINSTQNSYQGRFIYVGSEQNTNLKDINSFSIVYLGIINAGFYAFLTLGVSSFLINILQSIQLIAIHYFLDIDYPFHINQLLKIMISSDFDLWVFGTFQQIMHREFRTEYFIDLNLNNKIFTIDQQDNINLIPYTYDILLFLIINYLIFLLIRKLLQAKSCPNIKMLNDKLKDITQKTLQSYNSIFYEGQLALFFFTTIQLRYIKGDSQLSIIYGITMICFSYMFLIYHYKIYNQLEYDQIDIQQQKKRILGQDYESAVKNQRYYNLFNDEVKKGYGFSYFWFIKYGRVSLLGLCIGYTQEPSYALPAMLLVNFSYGYFLYTNRSKIIKRKFFLLFIQVFCIIFFQLFLFINNLLGNNNKEISLNMLYCCMAIIGIMALVQVVELVANLLQQVCKILCYGFYERVWGESKVPIREIILNFLKDDNINTDDNNQQRQQMQRIQVREHDKLNVQQMYQPESVQRNS